MAATYVAMRGDFSNAAKRVLGEGGVAFLAQLREQRSQLKTHWVESDELLEAYAVLESHVDDRTNTQNPISDAKHTSVSTTGTIGEIRK